MLSPLRNRFGIPGVISVVALVFAMLGGAYAANNSSNDGATASAKAKRGPKGPKGATGPAGPAGAQGPAGAKGDAGANGSNGSNGATGSNGTNGQSVTTAPEPPDANCGDQEGVKLTSASGTNYVCNGANGAKGDTGNPWTAGGTLPSGATETGVWSVGSTETEANYYAPISFTVPLAAELDSAHTHYINAAGKESIFNESFEKEEVISTICLGTAAQPKAQSGHLCVYSTLEEGFEMPFTNAGLSSIVKPTTPIPSPGAARSGALLRIQQIDPGVFRYAFGSWAVTG